MTNVPAKWSTESDLRSPLVQPSKETTWNKPVQGLQQPQKLTIDDVLQQHCGEFGPWQLRHFVLASLAWALEGLHTMVMIFADQEPEFRCVGTSCAEWAKTVCGFEPGSWDWVGGAGSSTVAQWDLVCGEKFKVGLVQAVFFGGFMIGAGIFGHLSDSSLGRKGALTVVCIMNVVFGCLTALAPNYWVYLLLRLFTGISSGGTGLCSFVLATEPIGPRSRGVAGMSTFYFFSGGIALLSGIAYLVRSWHALYIASSIPSILFVALILPFVSESPRWYLIRGRASEAMKVMSSIAKGNGKHLPDNIILALDEEVNNDSTNGTQTDKEELETKQAVTGSLIDVIRSPVTRIRLFLAVFINFFFTTVYFGLSLNAVNLGTNLYLTVLINAVAEMPAYLIIALLLDKTGRKPLAIGTQWFSGAFCLVASLMSNVGIWKVLRMLCGVCGIFGSAGTYNLLFIYTTELFPTVVRNVALGVTQAAQVGAILAPIIVFMGGAWSFTIFGVFGIAGGLLSLFLPETLNQPLYDTFKGMEDAENGLRVA
ncbi:hypothetical protein K2173_025543 [Erythroxylum novogranatense]|uniref:Major facilitator superfamily (MFS) profile domain-containing protein n=1 Tax=Erythroxylum novogranatense TaxID=1862640 RepID=A0AAV8TAD9_9ROSI|nr:hypothetical protein K2173_025543 [Erythroxylum novogranatense]